MPTGAGGDFPDGGTGMTYWTAILLGLIQGLAEFLPISSSGHLAILQNFLRIGDLENQMLELESRRYAQLREYMAQTRRLRHDFRQHLHVIAGLTESGKMEELRAYLKEYESEFVDAHATFCANGAMDAIAGYYAATAAQKNIPLAWQLNLPEKLPMREADLCMVLGNLLENALRASERLPEAMRRVSVICHMLSPAMMGLIVENRYDGQLSRREGKLLSTSHPGFGTGLLSVETVAKKYHGQMTVETENGVFRVNVLLNL